METKKDSIIEATEYLEHKYNQEFVFNSKIDRDIDIPYSIYVFEARDFSNVRVSVYQYEDGTFHDDFYGLLIAEKYERRIKQIFEATAACEKCYSTFRSSTFPDACIDPAEMNDMLHTYYDSFAADILVVRNNDVPIDRKSIDTICSDLKNAKIHGTISIYEIPEQELSMINDDVLDYLLKNPKIEAVISEPID